MVPIGKIKHPKPCIYLRPDRITPRGTVKVPLSELWFAVGAQVAISLIVLEHIDDATADPKRSRQLRWLDEIEVVSGSVILRECPPNTSHQTAYRKVETRRAVLALVVAIGREFQNFRRFAAVAENMRRCLVNLCISSAALLVMESVGISDASQHQSVANASDILAVSCQPRDRANRSGDEQEAIRVAKIFFRQKLRQGGRYRKAGEIVIG